MPEISIRNSFSLGKKDKINPDPTKEALVFRNKLEDN